MVKANEKARILLVDDEPRMIYLVREVLGATGYEVRLHIRASTRSRWSPSSSPP